VGLRACVIYRPTLQRVQCMYVCMYVGGSHGVMQLCYNELQREIPLHKLPYQNQLDPFRRYDTTPVCDRQTDGQTHDDSVYRATV